MCAVKRPIALLALLIWGLLLTACGGETNSSAPPSSPAAATKAPDEAATLNALRSISEAQATYFTINRRYALTLDELLESRLLNSAPSSAETGYEFKLRPAADAQTYKLSVVPASPSTTASVRYFFTDQTRVLREETGKEATADSRPVK